MLAAVRGSEVIARHRCPQRNQRCHLLHPQACHPRNQRRRLRLTQTHRPLLTPVKSKLQWIRFPSFGQECSSLVPWTQFPNHGRECRSMSPEAYLKVLHRPQKQFKLIKSCRSCPGRLIWGMRLLQLLPQRPFPNGLLHLLRICKRFLSPRCESP